MLIAENISLSAGSHTLLKGVSCALAPGQVHALLGANGAGKSSLLKVLAGELTPHSGQVSLNGQPLAHLPPLALARWRAVLPQHDELRFNFTAAEVVALGRYSQPSGNAALEAQAVRECLAATDASPLAQRAYPLLSGGERARVQLARVLAQLWPLNTGPARYVLLDEPTAALDIAHQHHCLQLARQLAAQGLGILVVLHDLNLAARYADHITLLAHGQCLAHGPPLQVLQAENLQRAFGKQLSFELYASAHGLTLLSGLGQGLKSSLP